MKPVYTTVFALLPMFFAHPLLAEAPLWTQVNKDPKARVITFHDVDQLKEKFAKLKTKILEDKSQGIHYTLVTPDLQILKPNLNHKPQNLTDYVYQLAGETMSKRIDHASFMTHFTGKREELGSLFKADGLSDKGKELFQQIVAHHEEIRRNELQGKGGSYINTFNGLKEEIIFTSGYANNVRDKDGKKTTMHYRDKHGVAQYRIPTLVRVGNELLAGVSARHSTDGDNGTTITYFKRYSLAEKKWSEQMTAATKMTSHTQDGTFVYDEQSDTLHCIYKIKKLHHVMSKDKGKTWGKAKEIDILKGKKLDYICVGPGAGITHEKYNVIYPVHYTYKKNDGSKKTCAYFIYYKDGKWHECPDAYSTAVGYKKGGPNESSIAQWGKGFVSIARNTSNSGYRMVSRFDGQKWSPSIIDKNLPMASCQGMLIKAYSKKFAQDVLIFSSPYRGRQNGMIRMSLDGGKTWPYQRAMTPERSCFTYSSMCQLPNGKIAHISERGWYPNGKRMSIVYTEFSIDWIINKK